MTDAIPTIDLHRLGQLVMDKLSTIECSANGDTGTLDVIVSLRRRRDGKWVTAGVTLDELANSIVEAMGMLT